MGKLPGSHCSLLRITLRCLLRIRNAGVAEGSYTHHHRPHSFSMSSLTAQAQCRSGECKGQQLGLSAARHNTGMLCGPASHQQAQFQLRLRFPLQLQVRKEVREEEPQRSHSARACSIARSAGGTRSARIVAGPADWRPLANTLTDQTYCIQAAHRVGFVQFKRLRRNPPSRV